jgi:hypothetical protein
VLTCPAQATMIEDIEAKTKAWMEEKQINDLFEVLTANLLYVRPEVRVIVPKGRAASSRRDRDMKLICVVGLLVSFHGILSFHAPC